jgi:hypothetical protein
MYMAVPPTPKKNTPFMARLLPGPRRYLGFNAVVYNYQLVALIQIDASRSLESLVKRALRHA